MKHRTAPAPLNLDAEPLPPVEAVPAYTPEQVSMLMGLAWQQGYEDRKRSEFRHTYGAPPILNPYTKDPS